MIELPVAAAKDSATAYGVAATPIAAEPAIRRGAAMILSFAIMHPVYHFPVNLKHLIFGEPCESPELRNHLCSKPFHLLSILGDGRADRVEQDHLGAGVDHLAYPANHVVRRA